MTAFSSDIVTAPAAISALTGQAMDFLKDGGVDGYAAHHVALVLDEILTNIVMHGGGPTIEASVRLQIRPDRVTAEILDAGTAFDPRAAQAPQITGVDRPIGGVGLLLVRQVASDLGYERRGNKNWTTFSVARRSLRSQGN